MSTKARKKLVKDYRKFESGRGPMGIFASANETNMMICDAVIYGPDETLWEGGTFSLRLEFTEEYPDKPPDVRFLTKMFHPNIYADGKICLDILQKEWSPLLDIGAVLQSIQSLLNDPNPDSPANSEAARFFVEEPLKYQKLVRLCVEDSWIAGRGESLGAKAAAD